MDHVINLTTRKLIMTTKCSQVRLFTEEVDKITSLVIGLSSRLAKASLLPAGQQDEKLQVIEVAIVKRCGKEQLRT